MVDVSYFSVPPVYNPVYPVYHNPPGYAFQDHSVPFSVPGGYDHQVCLLACYSFPIPLLLYHYTPLLYYYTFLPYYYTPCYTTSLSNRPSTTRTGIRPDGSRRR